MTLEQITELDKDLLAARYEAAITEEFGALAKFLDTTIETMIARSVRPVGLSVRCTR
jgi:hypothetical protein